MRTMKVAEVEDREDFTREDVAALLAVRPESIMRYWVEESQDAGGATRFFLFATLASS